MGWKYTFIVFSLCFGSSSFFRLACGVCHGCVVLVLRLGKESLWSIEIWESGLFCVGLRIGTDVCSLCWICVWLIAGKKRVCVLMFVGLMWYMREIMLFCRFMWLCLDRFCKMGFRWICCWWLMVNFYALPVGCYCRFIYKRGVLVTKGKNVYDSSCVGLVWTKKKLDIKIKIKDPK